MNYLKIFVCSLLFIALGATHLKANTRTVLVLGANQFNDETWSERKNGQNWMMKQFENVDLTTISFNKKEENDANSNAVGEHVAFNWKFPPSIGPFSQKNKDKFDVIINDFGTSYELDSSTLGFFAKTLKVGGKFAFGSICTRTLTSFNDCCTNERFDVEKLKISINKQCQKWKIAVDTKVVEPNDNELKGFIKRYLPPDHDGKQHASAGSWVIITRTK